jgi:hypothetical protein
MKSDKIGQRKVNLTKELKSEKKSKQKVIHELDHSFLILLTRTNFIYILP